MRGFESLSNHGGAAAAAAATAAAASATQGSSTLTDILGPGVSAQALLTAPPLVAITLDITRLKRAGAMLPITPVEHQAFDRLMDDLSDHIATVNRSVREVNRDPGAQELELGPIKDQLQAMRRITQALNRPPYTQERSRITSIISVIERSFTLLEKDITHRIATPDPAERAKVKWQTHGFHAEQSLIHDNTAEQAALEKLLQDLSGVFTFDDKAPQCFISYAWPTPENKAQEYWVQPFLKRLRAQLRLAGIHALLDIEDNITTRNIRSFAVQISESDYALCFCTESLKDKDRSPNYRVIQRELNLLKEKHERDVATLGQTQVLYVLGSGDHHTGYPEELREYRTVYDWRDKGYVKGLETLLRNLYGFRYPRESTDHQAQWAQFDALWTGFYQAFPDREQVLTPAAIQAALAKPVPRPTDYSALLSAFRDLSEEQDPILFAPLFRLPLRLPHFTGRVSALRTIATQLESDQVGVVTSGGVVQQSVSGLGGVGKTSLLLEYAHRVRAREPVGEGSDAITPTAYDHIIWLSGKEPLSAFKALAQERLGLDPSIYDKVPVLMRKIYETLMARYPKVLLILDDVKDEASIRPFIPRHTSDGRLHLLISSRSQHWSSKAIALDSFTPEEARAYILGLLPDETPESADALAKTLHYFPLALSQAVAYIQQPPGGIADYLTTYASSQGQLHLLNNPPLEDSQQLFESSDDWDDRQKAVYTTWHISIEALQEKQPEAEKVLNLSAYFAPRGIPFSLFRESLSLDPFSFKQIWVDLQAYSLIAIDQGGEGFSVHQLLQEVIRCHHREAQGTEKASSARAGEVDAVMGGAAGAAAVTAPLPSGDYLAQSLAILDAAFGYDKIEGASKNMAEWRANAPLLRHIAALLNYVDGVDAIAEQVGRLGNSAGCLAGDLGDVDQEKAFLECALKINESHYGTDHVEVARTLNSLANAYGDLGDVHQKKTLLERALKIQESHYGADHVVVAGTLNNLGNAIGDLGDVHQQKTLCERALKIQESHYGTDHVDVSITLGNLALAIGALGDVHQKKTLLERALKIKESHFGADHVEVAKTLNNLGNAIGDLGDVHQQKTLCERALKIQELHYGTDHVDVALSLGNLANAIGVLGDVHQQKSLLERALKIQEAHYGVDHVKVALTLGNLANAIGVLGDVHQQKTLLERALKIEEAHYGADHVEVALTLGNLANAIGALGDVHQQKTLCERALKIQESHFGVDHVEVARILNNLAAAIGTLGDVHETKVLLERALKIQESHFGADHVEVARTRFNLGLAELQLGNKSAAVDHVSYALKVFQAFYADLRHPNIQKAEQVLQMCQYFGNEAQALVSTSISTSGLLDYNLPVLLRRYKLPDASQSSLEKALRMSVVNFFYEDLEQLLQEVDNINAQDDNPTSQKTALHWAVIKENQKAISSLLSVGAACDIPDADGKTALDYAHAIDDINTIQLFIEFFLEAEGFFFASSPQVFKHTALHRAVHSKNHKAISALLKANVGYDIPDANGKTALDYAHEADDFDLIRLFIEFFLEEEGMALSLYKTPELSRNFFEFLQEQKILPSDLPYSNFEKHFASHAERTDVQEAYQKFMAGQSGILAAAAAASSVITQATSVQTRAPALLAPSAQSSTSAVSASSATAGIFGASHPASPLAMLLLQTQKQIPEPGQVQLIFKTETEAEDCLRQLQA